MAHDDGNDGSCGPPSETGVDLGQSGQVDLDVTSHVRVVTPGHGTASGLPLAPPGVGADGFTHLRGFRSALPTGRGSGTHRGRGPASRSCTPRYLCQTDCAAGAARGVPRRVAVPRATRPRPLRWRHRGMSRRSREIARTGSDGAGQSVGGLVVSRRWGTGFRQRTGLSRGARLIAPGWAPDLCRVWARPGQVNKWSMVVVPPAPTARSLAPDREAVSSRATSSAIWAVLSAAPLRRLSPQTKRSRVLGKSSA